jgi:hypothetical protein
MPYFGATLTDESRVDIYNCNMFIIKASGLVVDVYIKTKLEPFVGKKEHISTNKEESFYPSPALLGVCLDLTIFC